MFISFALILVDEMMVVLLDSGKREVVFTAVGVLINLMADEDKRGVLRMDGGVRKYVTFISYSKSLKYILKTFRISSKVTGANFMLVPFLTSKFFLFFSFYVFLQIFILRKSLFKKMAHGQAPASVYRWILMGFGVCCCFVVFGSLTLSFLVFEIFSLYQRKSVIHQRATLSYQ